MKKNEEALASTDNRVNNQNKTNRHKTLEERVLESEKPLEAANGFDFGEPRGREVW